MTTPFLSVNSDNSSVLQNCIFNRLLKNHHLAVSDTCQAQKNMISAELGPYPASSWSLIATISYSRFKPEMWVSRRGCLSLFTPNQVITEACWFYLLNPSLFQWHLSISAITTLIQLLLLLTCTVPVFLLSTSYTLFALHPNSSFMEIWPKVFHAPNNSTGLKTQILKPNKRPSPCSSSTLLHSHP